VSTSAIPLWSYEQEYVELRDEVLAACDRVFRSGRLILGEEGKKIEQRMADAVGMLGGVGVNSGTDAIFIALTALGVQKGDEVITVPNTAVPTVAALVTMGARPVLVDVNEYMLMDVGKVEAAITEKTRAIVPVHLYGQCVDMDPLLALARKHNLKVLEDVAQAQGATYKGRQAGSMGDAATYSFYPTKILGAYGDGGMILCRDEAVLKLARSIRYYGMETVYYSERHGYNSRLDELQAAILLAKFPHLPDWIARRREIAAMYRDAFRNTLVQAPAECEYGTHVYHLFVVQHPERDRMLERLAERGVTTGVAYRWPIHVQRGFQHLGYREGDFPVAEKAASRIFSLPMYPHLTDEQVGTVISAVLDAA
jgi:aminotransferase EvaB